MSLAKSIVLGLKCCETLGKKNKGNQYKLYIYIYIYKAVTVPTNPKHPKTIKKNMWLSQRIPKNIGFAGLSH